MGPVPDPLIFEAPKHKPKLLPEVGLCSGLSTINFGFLAVASKKNGLQSVMGIKVSREYPNVPNKDMQVTLHGYLSDPQRWSGLIPQLGVSDKILGSFEQNLRYGN